MADELPCMMKCIPMDDRIIISVKQCIHPQREGSDRVACFEEFMRFSLNTKSANAFSKLNILMIPR